MYQEIPITLRRIFEVYFLVRKFGVSRLDAIKRISKDERVAPHTITSVCVKRLNITIRQFDELLQAKNRSEFQRLLNEHFPFYESQIEAFFCEISATRRKKTDDSVMVVKTLFPEVNKFLVASLILKEIQDKLKTWNERPDIPDDIKDQLNQWMNKIDETF